MPARRISRAFLLLSAAILLAAFSTAAAEDAAKLSIQGNKSDYYRGESVNIPVRIRDTNQTLVNITLEVDYPEGSLFLVRTQGTDPSGTAGFSFRLPRDAPAGIYNLTASCRVENASLLAQSSFRVAPPKKPGPVDIPVVPLAGTALIGLLAAGIAVTATETGKFGFLALFAPLFTRLNRDDALDNRVRHQILGYLTENPGQHYNALKKALSITNGGMVYHLLVLEREGFIRSQRDGILKRFYPSSIRATEKPQRTPDELVLEIIGTIEKRPGITQKELVERLVVSDEVVGYHLRKLVRDSRIISWKKGRTRVYHPVKKA